MAATQLIPVDLPQLNSPRPELSLRESDRLLTIHRRTRSHHGRTLQILGHAAEHLNRSRAFDFDARRMIANREAVSILLRLSREVFDDYTEQNQQPRPVTDWLMRQAVRIYGAA